MPNLSYRSSSQILSNTFIGSKTINFHHDQIDQIDSNHQTIRLNLTIRILAKFRRPLSVKFGVPGQNNFEKDSGTFFNGDQKVGGGRRADFTEGQCMCLHLGWDF